MTNQPNLSRRNPFEDELRQLEQLAALGDLDAKRKLAEIQTCSGLPVIIECRGFYFIVDLNEGVLWRHAYPNIADALRAPMMGLSELRARARDLPRHGIVYASIVYFGYGWDTELDLYTYVILDDQSFYIYTIYDEPPSVVRSDPRRTFAFTLAELLNSIGFVLDEDGNLNSEYFKKKVFRKNPDDKLRNLELQYQLDPNNPEIVIQLSNYYYQLGMDKGDEIQIAFLQPELQRFLNAFLFSTNRRRPPYQNYFPLTRQELAFKAFKEIADAKEALIKKSDLLGVSPSYYYYRPYHHIPYINTHIEQMAYLHNAIAGDAYRDDDYYYGKFRFLTQEDAIKFKEAVARHHFPADEILIRVPEAGETEYYVDWSVGK